MVLAVDDDERLLAALSRTKGDAQIVTARTPEAALELAAEHQPTLAVVDMRLGGHSGIELVRELKRNHPDMTVVLCSAYLSVPTTVAAMRAGADEVVAKPVTIREVLRRMADDERTSGTSVDDAETPTLARAEYEHIMRVLDDCGGNLSETARRLGIYRSTLKRRLRKVAPV